MMGVTFRPGIDAAMLSDMISAHISGFAIRIAGDGAYTDHDAELFTRSVQAMIYATIDPGDGRSISESLNRRVAQPVPPRSGQIIG